MNHPSVLCGEVAEAAATVPEVCPSCGSSSTADFFECRNVPVHVGMFYDSPEEARLAPRGDIALSACRDCGFIHNRLFDPSLIAFGPGYEVGLQHSPTFRSFIEGVALRLIERFDLHDRQVLEIGCGNGFFLRLLCELGGNHGVGVDPTVSAAVCETAGRGTVRFIRDYFREQHALEPADLICCLSVFEDIPQPGRFLRMLRTQLGERRPALYFEVFNAAAAIANRETWSIHYEQCNYYSRETLAGTFRNSGFDVLNAEPCYQGGQYVFVEAVPGDPSPGACTAQPAEDTRSLPPQIQLFQEHHRRCVEQWNSRLTSYRQLGKKVVVWGSGGKGIMFLNSVPAAGMIRHVVEINPEKHGRYLPGSGQEIVPPSFMTDYQPDVIIITNPLYEPEMKQQAAALGVTAEFLIAGDC